MGLFDIFKKKENNTEKTLPKREEDLANYSFIKNEEGKLQIDYIESNPDFKKFYDTTRLIVDKTNGNLADCRVSWYNQDDAMLFDRKTGEDISRRTKYSNILTELDYDLLQNDKEYVIALMEKLLNQKRVNEYLERGMQEKTEMPCGKYVGSIQVRDNKYKKVFDPKIGTWSHNSPEMMLKRQKARDDAEIKRQEAIENKKAQIAKLQSEIDGMSK